MQRFSLCSFICYVVLSMTVLHFTHEYYITLILLILFTCLNGSKIIISQWCYGLSLMEKYIANIYTVQMQWRKEFFQNGGEAGWPINTLYFELVKEGITYLKFSLEESKWERICIKWWDQQLYDTSYKS